MAIGNSIATGSLDGNTLGSSTISAKKILDMDPTNKNRSSTRAIDYLASGMDFKQMADIGFGKDKATEAMQVYGIGKLDVRRMAASKIGSLMKAELSDPATSATVAKVIKSLEDGISPEGTLKNLSKKERMEFNVALQNRTRGGGEEAQTLADVFSGMGLKTAGRKLKTGDALGSKLSGIEGAEAQRAAEEVKRSEEALRTENKDGKFEKKLTGAQEAAKAQKDLATNLGGSVSILVEHLDKLATAVRDAGDKINGKTGMKPVKAKSP